MTIGSSIVLLAVGAILKWAVTAHVKGIDIQTAGTVLFVLGIVGLILAVAYTFRGSFSRRDGIPPSEQDTRYYQQ